MKMRRKMRWLLVLGAVVAPLVLLTQPGRAEAPIGRYEVSADTVFDTKTGLTWRRAVHSNSFTFAAAATHCSSLGGGWRLPTKKELESIVDVRRTSPAIDPDAFPNTPSTYFWTSSVGADDSSDAWVVDFHRGATANLSQSVSYRVRCVR